MELRRIIMAGVINWIAIFFEVSMLMFGLNLSGAVYYYAHYVVSGIITALIAVFFMKIAGKGLLKEGFKSGVLMLAVGIVLDAAITVPLFVKDYAFFLSPALLIGYLEGVAVVSVVGFVKEKKHRQS